MPHAIRLLIVLAAAGAAAGCLTTGATADLQTDIDEIQQQIWKVQKDTAALNVKVDALRRESETAVGPAAALPPDPDERLVGIQNELQILRQRIDEMNFRMDAIVQALRETSRAAGAPGTAGSGAAEVHPPLPVGGGDRPGAGGGPEPGMVSPEELYQNAYADYSRGNYQLAVLGFQEYVRRFPDSELADNAQYWVGESYFSSGDFESAIGAFDLLLARYPNGDRLPGAHLKKGLSYLEENRTPQGVLELQYLVRNYPQSDEARLAREHLQRLGLSVQ